MRIFRAGDALDDDARGAIFAIGNFDGLHRGHVALFRRAQELAREHGALAGVLTFSPHPARVLNPGMAPQLILRDDEKEQGIAALGLDLLTVLRFDRSLAALTAPEFVLRVLVDQLGARGVVVGEGFRFGNRAAGTVDDLRALPVVGVVPPVKEGDLVCSSSKVRELVLEGRVDAAGTLLGRPYFLEGVVVEGDRRGRTIDVPTANLDTGRELLPKLGVYATRAHLADGRTVKSVTNIGLRPTFMKDGNSGAASPRIEAHLLDFKGDLYGQRVSLDVIARIRDEMRFPGVAALKEQIARDIASARAGLA
ncbi:MAG TPA: riboflavin biosynthesis protein RibF [Myxococcota bacterium]|jgi:riboflavin kinase/FMN adenylyltransferase